MATCWAALITGRLRVMRSAGGLGELLTGSTQPSARRWRVAQLLL